MWNYYDADDIIIINRKRGLVNLENVIFVSFISYNIERTIII